MVRLREIPRTATFAWSPGPTAPLIATGTKAGAVDADFSNDTTLELWELNLDTTDQGVDLQPVATINADSRFNDIAWSQPSEQHPKGIIAGALDSGALVLWDAEKLRAGASDALIEQIDKHTGPIQAIQFNPFRPHILASAGAKGELYVHDLDDQSKSFRLGKAGANPDEYTTLDWNKKVAHILATGSSGGFVTVWDVRGKKENLTLNNYGRKSVSAVSWDPDVPTRLVTAIPTDQNPLVLVWDLRNSNAPEKTLQAHDQGVLSLSWCVQDSDILLSCGKDNRTIAWNPHTGESLGEFPVVTNWTFQTRFNPSNPNLLATASFDGKIAVQTLQNTAASGDQAKAASQALDGEDFFSKTHVEPQGASFSLQKPPKWLQRRAGVSFGFGGKLVRLGVVDSKSKISISTFVVDSDIGAASEEFDKALQQDDLTAICESKIAKASTEEEKADWTVIETLISQNPRRKLVEYLGFPDSKEDKPTEAAQDESAQTNGTAGADEGASFFDQSATGSNFLSDLAASKGAKTNNPFEIYTGSESEVDKKITRALMLGSFDAALDICLKEDRLSDAFMIAICGGEKCIEKAQRAYFKKRADGPNYLRLLASVVGKNLWDVVYNADLKDWKEVMATICTFADQSEFPDLCEALGDRLGESISDETRSFRKDASFCYLAGSKLEKVVVNWAQELQESEAAGVEQSTNDTSFSIHARSLQDFIEKVTVFREVTQFKDPEQQKDTDWKLSPLYTKYVEYADVAAAHGQLSIAEKYLDLLPEKYPAADVARNRIKQATRKAAPQPAATQRQTQASTVQRGPRAVPAYQPVQTAPAPVQQTSSPYAPPANTLPTQSAAPTYPAANPRNPYTPPGYAQPVQQAGIPQPAYGGYQPPQHHHHPIAPPPRNFSSSPSVPPTAKQSNIPNWNDTPNFGPPKPASRRGTPGLGANTISSPFPNQQNIGGPPQGPPQGISPTYPTQRPTPPPPPKGPPQGPPRISSPATAPPLNDGRPSSSAANAYAPPQPSSFAHSQQPSIPRGGSPYNPPPSAAPPSNRYAPAPSAAPSVPQGGMPPPPRQIAPPPNPYASRSYAPTPPPQAAPPQAQAPPPSFARSGPPQGPQGPPQGLPRAGPPPGGPPKPDSRPGTAQSQKAAPTAPKHPPGDRSHIPPSSRPIYEILGAEMQRVKARAPPQFKQHVVDTEKRLNILFDHLNNEELLKPDTIQEMSELAGHLQARNYDEAITLFTDLMTNKTEEGSNWMIGVKRLIQFSKSTPA
ncbi:WD40 repeat-like protein [Zopfia rhizophila CBS 207.26]|uniref:Protein transport protein SEC31 n=1 Tax=Zopfia rhizophila CBS 207.26 TaxID=1314779 RepID=A0A6A6EIQ6_9PEZI|nr:WD40 repeat-like protein [Zopfia rhizophila CBS 207.26]